MSKKTVDRWIKPYNDLDQERMTREVAPGNPKKGAELQEMVQEMMKQNSENDE